MASSSILLVSLLASAVPVQPGTSLRELCIEAPLIVLGRPTDPTTPTRFQVLGVLRGKGLTSGSIVAPSGLTAERVRTFDEPDLVEGKARPRSVVQALLFLDARRQLLTGGLRLCTEDGRVLAPSGHTFAIQRGVRWAEVLQRVREDSAAVDQLLARRNIARPAQRARALLDWAEKRKADLSAIPPAQPDDLAPAGWGRLAVDLFDWCLVGLSPEDAWPVIERYAELTGGDLPARAGPLFANPAGRTFLARLATAERRTTGERARALRLLADRAVLWPDDTARKTGAVSLRSEEQGPILEKLLPLLPMDDNGFRTALVRAVVALRPERDESMVGALEKVYRSAAPGAGRNALALALAGLCTPTRWKELTGNPPGICACLRDVERGARTLQFWLSLRTPGVQVYEQPTILLERLGTTGQPVETTRLPLVPVVQPRPWSAGWNGDPPLAVEFTLPALQSGQPYRLRVEGSVGQGGEKQRWLSEPECFTAPTVVTSPYPRRSRGRIIDR